MPSTAKINDEETEGPSRNRITTPMRLVLEHMLTRAEKIYGRGLCRDLGTECSGTYRLLHELEARGWLKSFWDHTTSQGRKYYTLTELGQRITKEMVSQRGSLLSCV